MNKFKVLTYVIHPFQNYNFDLRNDPVYDI